VAGFPLFIQCSGSPLTTDQLQIRNYHVFCVSNTKYFDLSTQLYLYLLAMYIPVVFCNGLYKILLKFFWPSVW